MSRVLTPEAQSERDDFERHYNDCSCHLSPPCGSCTHPGNPLNQEGDETAWQVEHEIEHLPSDDTEGGEA